MNRRTFLAAGAATLGAASLARLGSTRPAAAGPAMAGPLTAGPVTTDAIGDQVQTVPKGHLPVFADTDDTRRLYRYAIEHGDELQYMPCTCGCYRFGHTSNRDCYIKSLNPDGTLTFTSHAAT